MRKKKQNIQIALKSSNKKKKQKQKRLMCQRGFIKYNERIKKNIDAFE